MGQSIIKIVLVLTQFSPPSPLFLRFPHLQDIATTLKKKNVKSHKKRYPPLNININEMGCSCRAWIESLSSFEGVLTNVVQVRGFWYILG
jgi:hypothetical protein